MISVLKDWLPMVISIIAIIVSVKMNNKNKIVYYDAPGICIYDCNMKEKMRVVNQKLFGKELLDMKFSQDEKYVLYTVGDIPFFWSSGYRMSFFIVDLNTGNKIRTVKWENGDRFYGIDW